MNDGGGIFQVILIPRKWWSLSHWKLAMSVNGGLRITGLSEVDTAAKEK